jgi:hypothetical protein
MLQKIGAKLVWILGLAGTVDWMLSGGVATLAAVASAGIAILLQLPTILVVLFFVGGFLAIFSLINHGRRYITARRTRVAARPRTEAEELKHNCLQLGTRLNQLTEQWSEKYHEIEAREPTS